MNFENRLFNGDCLEVLPQYPDNSVDLVVTSPPYFNSAKTYQRGTGVHYTMDVGEPLYVTQDCAKKLFRIVKDDGFFCINLGFSYGETGVLRPFYVVERMLRYGWFVVDIIPWHKRNPIPIRNRLTNSFEFVFVISKMNFEKHFINSNEYVYVLGKHPLSKYPKKGINYIHNFVETNVARSDGDSSAPFPFDLAEFLIDIYSNIGDVVLDPFLGRGTTASVAKKMGRVYSGIELNPKYFEKASKLVKKTNILPKYMDKDSKSSPHGVMKFLK
jgi:DNA modification methylase